jgi:tubulin beta
MQAGQCGNHKNKKFWVVMCSEHGIGGDGEYFDSDAQVGRVNLLAPHTNGPWDVPRYGALSLLQNTRTTGGIQKKSQLG